MSFTKTAAILIVALLVAGLLAMVRHRRTQPVEISTFEAQGMNDFKKRETSELKKNLSTEQFAVTQQCGTEAPFRNAYWNNHEQGIYVDVVSGEPLFSSLRCKIEAPGRRGETIFEKALAT